MTPPHVGQLWPTLRLRGGKDAMAKSEHIGPSLVMGSTCGCHQESTGLFDDVSAE